MRAAVAVLGPASVGVRGSAAVRVTAPACAGGMPADAATTNPAATTDVVESSQARRNASDRNRSWGVLGIALSSREYPNCEFGWNRETAVTGICLRKPQYASGA
jgi:hypothetical protein